MSKTLSRDQIRQKYMSIANSAGIDQAITELHREIGNRAEPAIYAGGYEKNRLEHVTWLREFARELYNFKTAEASKIYEEKK